MTRQRKDENRPSRRAFMRQAGLTTGLALAAGRASAAASANGRLGVGVIGCGGRGNAHLKVLDWLKDNDKNLEIVAVCDVYRPRLERAAQNYGAKAYMDHRELLADPRVDAVTIATPDHHHGYQAIDAVEAGKTGVYCEKPVTHWRQFDLTKKLAGVVAGSDCAFQLGSQGMSDSAWHQIAQFVREGLIGKPIYGQCSFFRIGDWGERGMPIDDPNAKPGPDLNWEAFLGDSPKRDFDVSRFFRWRMYWDYAGGPSTDLFPHALTPVLHMLGAGMPSKVVATGGKFRYEEREVPDTFNMLIDYPEDITVAALGTQGNDYNSTGRRGSGQGIPVIRGWDGSLTIQNDEIVFIPVQGVEKKEQRFAIDHGEDMVEYMRSFITACHEGKKDTLSPMDLAFRVQTPLQMGILSLRQDEVALFDQEKQTIQL